jgi:hypothetical protein
VQRATAQSKTGIFRDNGVAEAPPGFQAVCISFLSFCSFCLNHEHFERLNLHTFFYA